MSRLSRFGPSSFRLCVVAFGVVLAASAHTSGSTATPGVAERRLAPHAAPAQSVQPAAQPRSAVAAVPEKSANRALLDQYCSGCHNERLKTGGLVLTGANVDQPATDPALWEKVIRKVGSGSMPPAGMPRPNPEGAAALISHLERSLDRAAAASPLPSPPTVHRLNRVEYVNAVRDLLGLDIDGAALLPVDDNAYGFDNNADMLSMSPAVLDRYFSAAMKISRIAVGDAKLRPASHRYSVPLLMRQNARANEELPFGTQGGAAVRHTFPLDGEYQLRIRLQRQAVQGYISGIERRHTIEARIDGVLLRDWHVGGELPAGGEDAVVGIALDENNKEALARHTYRQNADEGLELRFTAQAGTRVLGVSFVSERPGFSESISSGGAKNDFGLPGAGIDFVEISGPYSATVPAATLSRQKIFICSPQSASAEAPCAKKIFSALAQQAYRRPVSDADLAPLLALFEADRRERGFEGGIQRGLERLLVSPQFLFRIERTPRGLASGAPYRLSDLEVASRLSFFLWSSIPDEELLRVAERGRLKEPAILNAQVKRMLADPRATALVNNFAGQWLLVRNTRLWSPDTMLYPAFDSSLKEAFAQEMELFFASQLREDRSVLDLLRADYTFVNERLAAHYGLQNVYGSHFRRVTLADQRRWGLFGKGAVLMVTSYPHRTSPVLRGKWILENLLGAPPPPPPPNVPTLKENDGKSKPTTVRERLEQHRANALCASCHAQMDPLGFALENFDAIGQWRDADGPNPIDASSRLLDGTRVNGPAEFRQALLSRREQFVTTLAEKLLTYALGRGADHNDMPAIREIVRSSAANEYRWSDLITEITRSAPFQMARVPAKKPNAAPATTVASAKE